MPREPASHTRDRREADCDKARVWLQSAGNFELATAYCGIFWPAFVRFEHYVLREGFDEASLRDLEDITNCHTSAIEEAVNRLRIAEIHPGAQPSEDQARTLGRTLKDIHAAKLEREFPELGFEVSFNDEPCLDVHDYELSFWQSESRG